MTIISNFVKYLLFVFAMTGLNACAPLRFDMYARNRTNNITYLTLIYRTDKADRKKNIEVKYADSVLDINRRTREKLNQVLDVTTVDDNQILLIIPPHSTIHLSDLIYSIYEFADKTLVFRNANNTDSIRFNYPYRRIKGVKHKRGSPLNFFYRMILYYDIKQE